MQQKKFPPVIKSLQEAATYWVTC